MERNIAINKLPNVDNNILLTGVVYHDLGLVVGREKQEKTSARLLAKIIYKTMVLS